MKIAFQCGLYPAFWNLTFYEFTLAVAAWAENRRMLHDELAWHANVTLMPWSKSKSRQRPPSITFEYFSRRPKHG